MKKGFVMKIWKIKFGIDNKGNFFGAWVTKNGLRFARHSKSITKVVRGLYKFRQKRHA